MKIKYFLLLIVVVIAGSILTGCSSNRDKLRDDKEDVKQAAQDLKNDKAI